jgi:DnaJ-class molecular chaperone
MVKCLYCNGTGQYLEHTCPQCLGDGAAKGVDEITQSMISVLDSRVTTIEGKMAAGIPTYKILEATDSDEYTALDANKKAWYNLFISAGTLDMSDGSKAWDLFLSWIFPEGKISHAAILAILV